MLIYFIVALPIALQALLNKPTDKDFRERTLWLSSILLILFIGTRLQVGADWFNYLRIFRHASPDLITAAQKVDPGYTILNTIVRSIGVEIWGVNLVCAIIFVLGLRTFCRQQADPSLAMMIAFPYLVVVIAMGYSRQAVAIGCVMIAISAAIDRKFLVIVLSMFVAITFHRSAVIATPLVMLALTDTKLKMFGVAVLGVVCYVIFVQSTVDTLYDQYIERQMASSGAAIRVAMNMVPALLMVLFARRFQFSPPEFRVWMGFTVMAFATAIALTLSPASTAVDRIALYLIPMQLAVLSRFPLLSSSRQAARVAVTGYSLAVLFIWLNYASFSYTWLPYRTYLWVPSDFTPSYRPL